MQSVLVCRHPDELGLGFSAQSWRGKFLALLGSRRHDSRHRDFLRSQFLTDALRGDGQGLSGRNTGRSHECCALGVAARHRQMGVRDKLIGDADEFALARRV